MTEVKDRLIERLKGIENKEFLNSLLHLIESVDENGVYEFSQEQKDAIDKSIDQIKRGEFKSHEQVMAKFRK